MTFWTEKQTKGKPQGQCLACFWNSGKPRRLEQVRNHEGPRGVNLSLSPKSSQEKAVSRATAGYVGETGSRVEQGPVSDQKEAAVFLHPGKR